MLFVLNNLGVGGSEIKVIKLANQLARRGETVSIAYLNSPETLLAQISPEVRSVNLQRRGKFSIGALFRLRKLVGLEKDAVVAVNLYPLLYVVPASKFWGTPGVRTISLVNTSALVGKERAFGNLYAQFLRRCDSIIFGCESQRSHWLMEYGLAGDRSHVIYNGVDYHFFSASNGADEAKQLREDLGIPQESFVVGSVGRLAPEKDYGLLIAAAANLNASGRTTYVVIAGDGAEKESLIRAADAAGIADKVRLLGSMEDVRPALSMLEVYVQCSKAETFSNAALEAMAMGRAALLSNIGGSAEMIEDGKSGMLFPIGDGDRLTEILSELCDSPEKRHLLEISARERVVECFGFSEMVSRYLRLLRRSQSVGE